ncbi:MAG: RNA polymerase-associated protein RapA [Chitinispirillaceae bacterium]
MNRQRKPSGNVPDRQSPFAPGQQWASEAEMELGMGTVISVENKKVTLFFQKKSVTRLYSTSGAPLKRMAFKDGDHLKTHTGKRFIVREVHEKDGLLFYSDGKETVPESQVAPDIVLGGPLDRLMSGQYDTNRRFRLRMRALSIRTRLLQSPVRGLVGGRIELLPHQLYIAKTVSDRHIRRVLLADEVGLGKTIESCLIMHRLLVSERIKRVLVIVPESLTHVWFVELLRKFNISFRIFDSEYWEATSGDGINPFQYEQLVLCSAPFLYSRDIIRQAAVWARWDLVIADEVHHAEENTPYYSLLKQLSPQTENLLFLTATPQHHGDRNHFLRLRLLDPDRYADYDTFIRQNQLHKRIASITGALLDGRNLSTRQMDELKEFLHEDVSLTKTDSQEERARMVATLLDRHGVGRAIFRTTRASVGGFPKRNVSIETIPAPPGVRNRVSREALSDINNEELSEISFAADPRIPFIAELLRAHKSRKFLLICRSREKVQAIERALAHHITVKTAQFHEELSLIQRDRNAAWFGEEDGARILLCSEIGSEGRNFQFVNHMILFDIPANPELIEQRIGRLDRIGQQSEIWLHIPVIEGSPYDFLARWFHEGLGIFSTVAPWAQEVFDVYREELFGILHNPPKTKQWEEVSNDLISRTRKSVQDVSTKLREGRDRLLEQHSYHPKRGAALVNEIVREDRDAQIESFMLSLFEDRGIVAEEIRDRTYRLVTEGSLDELFPNLRTSRPVVTFSRAEAVGREDIEFITADHPVCKNAFDLLLGTNRGNCAVALYEGRKMRGLFLEAVYLIESSESHTIADLNRFLPPMPVRIVIDQTLQESTTAYEHDYEEDLHNFPKPELLNRPQVKEILSRMLDKAGETAQRKASEIIDAGRKEALETLGAEVRRLESLSEINPGIQKNSIQKAENQMRQICESITEAELRLDAVRVIVAGVV